MKYLFVVAHCDDEVLGFGGTIARLVLEGNDVKVVICAHRREDGCLVSLHSMGQYHRMAALALRCLGGKDLVTLDLPDEQFPSVAYDLKVKIEEIVLEYKPDVVFTHSAHDYNQDHRTLNDVCQIICRPWIGIKGLLFGEILSSTGPAFLPNFFIPLDDYAIRARSDAWNAYEPEHRPSPHPRSDMMVTYRPQFWGEQIGVPYAEAFEVGYWRI